MIKIPFRREEPQKRTGDQSENPGATGVTKTGIGATFYEARSGGNDPRMVGGVRVTQILPDGVKPEGVPIETAHPPRPSMGDSPAAAKPSSKSIGSCK